MSAESVSIAEAKAGACYYLLTMLLQRLDPQHPGLIDEILQGVIADFSAIEADGNLSSSLRAVLEETKTLLMRAGAYKNQAHPKPKDPS